MRVPMLDHFSRRIQFAGVMFFAFTLPITTSLLIFLGLWHPAPATSTRFVFKIAFELTALCILWLVLAGRAEGFGHIGFSVQPNFRDVAHSVVLFIGGVVATVLVYYFLQISHHVMFGSFFTPLDVRPLVFGLGASVWTIVLLFVNPFYEELLVRAFVITEIERRFNSTEFAVFVSVALQASYHLYQGLSGAFGVSMIFVLFSIYYVRTRRILPVILAHLYLDLMALLMYLHRV